MDQRVTYSGSFMQSFTSVGPMLDIVALFSAIAVYSGPYLAMVMLLSFVAAFTTIYVIWTLSKHLQSNGGYYLFAGKILGKRAGVSTSLLYVVYALLVIPNISLFVSFFSLHLFQINPGMTVVLSYAIPLIFLLVLTAIVSQGLGRSIKYTIGAGTLELIFILVLDVLFLKNATSFSIPLIPATSSGIYSVFSGVVFGVLAFAGMGSPVFLSEDTKKGITTIPRALKHSYLVTGLILVFSAFSIMAFLGVKGIASYSADPFFVNSSILASFGTIVYALFAVLAIVSSMNLCVAYSNGLFNAIKRMAKDGILSNIPVTSNNLILAFVLVEAVIITVANALLGNFIGFVVIAAIVSFSYMLIQIIVGLSLMKLSLKIKELGKFLVALISVSLLSVTIVFSLVADTGPGNPTTLSVAAFIIIAAVAFLIAYLGGRKTSSWFDKVNILNELESKA